MLKIPPPHRHQPGMSAPASMASPVAGPVAGAAWQGIEPQPHHAHAEPHAQFQARPQLQAEEQRERGSVRVRTPSFSEFTEDGEDDEKGEHEEYPGSSRNPEPKPKPKENAKGKGNERETDSRSESESESESEVTEEGEKDEEYIPDQSRVRSKGQSKSEPPRTRWLVSSSESESSEEEEKEELDEEYIAPVPRARSKGKKCVKAKETSSVGARGTAQKESNKERENRRGKGGRFISKKAAEKRDLKKREEVDFVESIFNQSQTPVRSSITLSDKQIKELSRTEDEEPGELGYGDESRYVNTGREGEKGQGTSKKIKIPRTVSLTPSQLKRTITLSPIRKNRKITLNFEQKRRIEESGQYIYEDTEEENQGEDIESDPEVKTEVEPDTTDELWSDYSTASIIAESKGKGKQETETGKENQFQGGTDRRLSPILHQRPKRFGLKERKNQSISGAEELADRLSPPYLRPSRFQKRKEREETSDSQPLVEASTRIHKKARVGDQVKDQSAEQVTESRQKKHTDIGEKRKLFQEEIDKETEEYLASRQNSKKGLFDDLLEKLEQEAQPTSKTNSQLPPLLEDTICISQFLKPQHFANLMPSLEVIKKRRTSPTTSTPSTVLVNGIRKADKIKLAPHRSPVSHRKPFPPKDKDGEGRNIDNIIFGNITFKAWYPSWYPKEIIGEKEGKDREVVSELYVCNKCFGYGKDVLEWRKHVKVCHGGLEKEGLAREVYRYGGWEGDGRWSVWEVDGAVETLFCQNLSLFAKLFLDNKSVFFDVSGFNYFLLVHTSVSDGFSPPERQIIGFFSKEKMSWDNNNLACILIFPPWQRKGLGALLIGVSYAIVKREGIMGGPEKPISELGMKGYKRFWGAEIARWLLQFEIKTKSKEREEVDIERVSRETWIAPEDCLAMVREMDAVEVVEEKGGKGLRKEGESGEKEAGNEKGKKVRIDKVKVREWIERNKLRLEWVVSEDGFLEGYALPEVEEEEEEELEEEDEEEEEEEEESDEDAF